MIVEPDLKIAGLSVWILTHLHSDDGEASDGTWLNIRAVVQAPGCFLETAGSLVQNREIAYFANQIARLDSDLVGNAVLDCVEPNLYVAVSCRPQGQVDVVVRLTEDHLTQSHEVKFQIDQSYLKPILRDCRAILARFPVS